MATLPVPDSSSERVILTSTVISDSEIEMDLSVEDLASGILEVDADSLVEEDDSDFQMLVDILEGAGYKGIENYDYEMLERLIHREHETLAFRNKEVDPRTVLSNHLESIQKDVTYSNATLQIEAPPDTNLEYLRANYAYNVDGRLYSCIDNVVYNAMCAGYEITPEEVFEKLKTSNVIDLNDHEERSKLLNYVEQVVPALVQLNKNSSFRSENKNKARYRTAKNLLKDEFSIMQRFKETPVEKIDFIKTFSPGANNREIETTCPLCGKKVTIKETPVRLLIVPPDKSNQTMRYDIFLPVFCEGCDSALIFTPGEYDRLAESVVNHYKVSNVGRNKNALINSAIQQEGLLCTGASCIKIVPPIAVVIDSLPELISDDEVGKEYTGETTEVIVGSTEQEEVEITIDSLEFTEAVDVFYKKLKMFGSEEDNDGDTGTGTESFSDATLHQTLAGIAGPPTGGGIENTSTQIGAKEIAAYILNTLSLDYTTEKNKAIFSLIYYFQDNPILNDSLDITKIWDLEDNLRLVSCLTENTLSKITKERKTLLLELYRSLKTLYDDDSSYKDVKSKTEDEQLMELLDMLPMLDKMYQKQKKKREEAIVLLESNVEAFGYCKLINLSSIGMYNLDSFIADDTIGVIDRITDLMLINGYAGDFFEVWQSFCVLPRKEIYDALLVSTSTVKSYNTVVTKMAKLIESAGVSADIDNNYYKVFILPIEEEHALLRKAYSAIRTQNYYRFCKSIEEIDGEIDSHVGLNLTLKLNAAIKTIKDIDDTKGMTESEYYLTDFTKEELKASKEDLELLSFETWIPKRLEGEGIDEYVARFRAMQQDNSFNRDNSRCLADKFDLVRPEALVISTAAIMSSAEYKSFSTSMFISRSICMLMGMGSQVLLQKFLNFTEELINFVKSETDFYDYSLMELKTNKDFYTILFGYYFTTVYKVIPEFLNEYTKKSVFASESLTDCYSEYSKTKKLEDFAEELRRIAETDEDSDDVETMLNEVESKLEIDSEIVSLLEESK